MAVLAYSTGLHGPFLLDDDANLRAIPQWLDGKLGLATVLFERGGGTLGRPVSMATFALNAWIGGYAPFPLKVGNLIVHLLCGIAIFCLLRLLLRRDALLQPRASQYAAIVASIWLLHPLHASTVLYVVQRMAQLSTLLVLLGLWVYVALRARLERGPSASAAIGLMLGIPAITAFAFLAKENGILLPLLCAVAELAFFGGKAKRPQIVHAFHGLYLILPALAGLTYFALRAGDFVGSYAGREFSLGERLLTQPRALCDYLFKLLLPNPPRMGIYTDDFIASTGLLSPPTTLIAIVALLSITLLAWHWRKRQPTVFFGWGFFLAAHALEAGPIPLELYFEHRNYLPSVGILAAAVALVAAAGAQLTRGGLRPQRIGAVLLIGSLAVLAFGTHGRARVWRSDALIAESALFAHPDSLRAAAAALGAAIDRGDEASARELVDKILSSSRPRTRSMGHAYRLYVDCVFTGSGNVRDLEAFARTSPMPLTLGEAQPFHFLHLVTETRPCAGVDDRTVGLALAQLVDRAHDYSDNSRTKISLRYQAASFLMRAGDLPGTLQQAKLAWQPAADPAVAQPLIMAQLGAGDIDGAERTLREVKIRADATNSTEQQFLDWLTGEVILARNQQSRSGQTP